MACVCALVAFAGFTPTYWAPVATGRFTGPSILHLHARDPKDGKPTRVGYKFDGDGNKSRVCKKCGKEV